MKLFRRLFRKQRADEYTLADPPEPPRPDAPLHIVGDIHGRHDLLRPLLRRLETEEPGATLVCVGDMVDRGDQSREVLTHLRSLATGRAAPTICLLGNHEQMLLSFLDDPEREGPRWLRHGGLQTLASYDVWRGPGRWARQARDMRDQLAEAMGPDTIDWLRGLPTWFISGNVAVVHAGADPFVPIPDQPGNALVWGHPDFGRFPRFDGMWVVHGHTIVDEPVRTGGRISIDTGAYATGRLTAARVSQGAVTFLSA